MWAMTAVSRGWRSSTSLNGPGPVKAPALGPTPAWTTDRDARVGEQTPDRVQQRVPGVEAAHLHVHLEHPRALASARATYAPTPGSGRNVAGLQDVMVPRLRCSQAKSRRPVVEAARHPGLCG